VVQGSAAEPYVVIISKDGNNLTAHCDCPAGNKGQYCKHRFELFKGSSKGTVGGDVDAIAGLPEFIEGTDVAVALEAVAIAEKAAEQAKKALSAVKKDLAKAMLD
jgi:hypothetical protein